MIGKRAAALLLLGSLCACAGADRDLRRSVQASDLQKVNLLLRAGADLNAPDEAGRTPLFLAVQEGSYEVASYLVAHGANVLAPDRDGTTPLHCAAEWGHPDLIRLLLASGADAGARDAYNRTPLQAACDKWNVSIPKLAADPSIEGLEPTLRAGFNAPPNCPKEQILALLSPGGLETGQAAAPEAATVALAAPVFRRPVRPDDFAIVAGISHYQGKDLPGAPFADRDALAMREYLRALGVPQDHIQLLTNEEATSSRLKGYLESWLPKNVKADSRVYFYFAGHGAADPVTRASYLMPWDGDPDYLDDSGARLSSLYQALAGLKAQQVVVMLDSCFSGAGGRSVARPGARPLVTIQSEKLPPGISLFAASQSDQVTYVLPDQGHGIFTFYWLKGLDSGLADSSALCRFLQDRVPAAAALQNGVQKPVCAGPKLRL